MAEAFYNQAYYDSHYGQFVANVSAYELKARFWKKAIEALWPVRAGGRMLDYGCGLGQVTAAFCNCHCYDLAEFSRDFLRQRGRKVYSTADEIPEDYFDVVISSHSLEHAPHPFEVLRRFYRCAIGDGTLLLILPIERDLGRHLVVDSDNHLFAWTFQTISNLLHATGWEPQRQEWIYDSRGLRRLGQFFSEERAVDLAWRLGRITGSFRSMFIAAKKKEGAV